MPTIETIRRTTLQARTEGVELATATLNRLAASSDGVTVATDRQQKAMLSNQSALDRASRAYTPLFAAQEKLIGLSKQLEIGQSTGRISQEASNSLYAQAVDKLTGYTKALEAATRAEIQARAAQASAAQATAGGNQQVINERLNVRSDFGGSARAADFEAAAAAADRLRNELVPLAGAERQFEAAVEKANSALASGIINGDEHTASISRAKNALLNQTNEINKADTANSRLAKGTGLNAYAWQNLGFQINDVVTSLASGISPFQTLAQQGGQITQVLQSDQGGIVGGLNSVKNRILDLLSPARLVFGGIATLAAGAGYATYSYLDGQKALTQSVGGAGRASGATVGQINALAPSAAQAAGVSTASAREMAGAYAATGRIGTEMYASLIKQTKDYATITGQDLPEATKAFAEAFADPAKGALDLNKQLGFLGFQTLETIRALQESGDRLGAQKTLTNALGDSLKAAGDRLGFFAKQWQDFKNTTSNEIDAIGGAISKAFTGGDLEARLAAAQKVLENAQTRPAGLPRAVIFDDRERVTAQAQVTRLQAELAKKTQESRASYLSDRSLEVGGLVKALNPASATMDDLVRKAANFNKYLYVDKGPDPLGEIKRAMDGLNLQAKQFATDIAAGGAQFADAIRAAQFGQRTVGFTPQGLSAAQINEKAANSDIEALRKAGNDTKSEAYLKQVQSNELIRVTELQTLAKQTTLDLNTVGGAFSRFDSGVQQQIVAAGNLFGKVPASLIAAIAKGESSGNANVGYSKSLGEDGRPSSAYGLGQITKGTAEEAVTRGYLPQGYDRTDAATMAQGIAAVLQMKIDQNGGDVTRGLEAYRGSRDPSVNRAYAADALRNAGQMGDPSQLGLVKDQDALTRAQRDAGQQLQNLNDNYGRNGAALETLQARQQKYNELLDRGVSAADAASIAFGGLIDKTVDLARQAKLVQFSKDDDFAREQLGRSATDQQAYSKARSLVGDTSSPAAQAVIDRSRDTANLTEAKGMITEGATSFVTELRRTGDAASALSNAFGNAADKLLSKALDSGISSLFSGATSGSSGSGLFGSLFGSSSAGDGWGSLPTTGGAWLKDGYVPSFANGLVPRFATGSSSLSAAGIVSGPGTSTSDSIPAWISNREAIIKASSVEHYGPEFIRSINDRTLRFAEGRTPPFLSPGMVTPANSNAGPQINAPITVNMQGSSGDPVTDQAHVDATVKAMRAEMVRVFHQEQTGSLRQNGALWKAGVRRAS